MRKRSPNAPWLCLIAALCALYCHRFLGAWFPFSGDAAHNIFFRLHESLLAADYNPYRFYYFSDLPVAGRFNPILWLLSHWLHLVPLSPVARALAVNILASWILLTLLGQSFFLLLRTQSFSPSASLVGSLLPTFTGFHLVGVREFDHMYLLSFLCVPPLVACFLELCRKPAKSFWIAGAALCIGVSLWGGSNAPLFYYLPLLLLCAPLQFLTDRDRAGLVRNLAAEAIAVALGVALAAPALLPAVAHFPETNRVSVDFYWGFPGISWRNKLYTLFLRDWWHSTPKGNYPELDYFVGLPMIALVLLGMWKEATVRAPSDRALGFRRLCLLFLLGAITVTSHTSLPFWAQQALGWFFHRLSIRFPNRFFMLALLPLAYYAARGFEQWTESRLSLILLGASAIWAECAIVTKVSPIWHSTFPDKQVAFWLSMGAASLATVALASMRLFSARYRSFGALAILCLYAMYLLAPFQIAGMSHEQYAEAPEIQRWLPPDRLEWRKLWGLTWGYDETYRRAKKIFLEPPAYLREPATRRGRVFDENVTGHAYLYAPFTGHHFAFSERADPGMPRRLSRLAENMTEAIKDLYGICWSIPKMGEREGILRSLFRWVDFPPSAPLTYRSTCFPEAFFVPRAQSFAGPHEVRTWMARATREQLAAIVAVDCSEAPCAELSHSVPSLVPSSRNSVSPPPAAVQYGQDGSVSAEIDTPHRGYVFFSIPYRSDWGAKLGGKPVPVIPVDGAFLAVPVPAGHSTVQLRLSPRWAMTGFALGSLALLFLAALLWRETGRPVRIRSRLSAIVSAAVNRIVSAIVRSDPSR